MKQSASILPGKDQNVNETERIVSIAAGSFLLFQTLSGRKNPVQALAAGYLLFRGTTGYCPLYSALQVNKPRTGNIEVKSYITVNKPREEVYAFWRKLENLPLFMKHLERVTLLDERHAEWKAKIPGHLGTITWKSEIVTDTINEAIAWRSLPGSQINNSGIVQFLDAGKFGTEVHVELTYHAPAGVIGASIGKLLNPTLEALIHEDIKDFRKHLETGEIPTYKGQSTGKTKEKL